MTVEDRLAELEQHAQRLIFAGDPRDRSGWGAWSNHLETRLLQERNFLSDVVANALAQIYDRVLDAAKEIVAKAVTRCIRGTYNPQSTYSMNDIVALDGGSFVARKDNPGPCPGAGWQLMAKQGQRGIAGPEGKRGPPGNIITGWIVDRSVYRVTPRLSDGTLGPPLDLRELFEPSQQDDAVV